MGERILRFNEKIKRKKEPELCPWLAGRPWGNHFCIPSSSLFTCKIILGNNKVQRGCTSDKRG